MTIEEMEATLIESMDAISTKLERMHKRGQVTPAQAIGAIQGLLDGFSFHFPETKEACTRLSAKLNENFLSWGTKFMPPNG